MSGRSFLDTNIFVYALDSAAPRKKGTTAKSLLRKVIEDRNGAASYQVIQELVNVVLRKFEVPLSHADLGDFIDNSFRRMLVIHSSLQLFHGAMAVQARYRLSWYDSIIVAAAIESGCTKLFSEDMQHGAKFGGVQVENPFR
jgi:predicted nucleic acid-binding protein